MSALIEEMATALEQGFSLRQAALKCGLSPSQASARRGEFGDAYDLAARQPAAREPLVEGLIRYLCDRGHFAFEAGGADAERATVDAYRYLKCRDALPGAGYMRVKGNSRYTRVEQARLAEEYVTLRKTGATDDQASAWLIRNGLTKYTIKRWADKHIGPGALRVGPFQDGHLRQKVMDLLAVAPLTHEQMALRLGVGPNTLWSTLRQLRVAKKIENKPTTPRKTWHLI